MQKQQKRTKTAKTKLSITRLIFKLEDPDFVWYPIYTKHKNVKMQNRQQHAKTRQKWQNTKTKKNTAKWQKTQKWQNTKT